MNNDLGNADAARQGPARAFAPRARQLGVCGFSFYFTLCIFGPNPVNAALPALSEPAYTQLVAAEPAQRLLAVVRCTRTERLQRGSRSERAVLYTVVVAAGGGVAPGSTVVLTRYAQGNDPLASGATYLVAAVREEYAPAYTLIDASVLGATNATTALAAATAELARRDPSSGGALPAAAKPRTAP